MVPISHMPSPRSISNSFHLWFNPSSFSFSRSISVISVVFLVVILSFEDWSRVSQKSCLFSRSFVVLASCYPLELFHLSEVPFLTHPEHVSSCFPISFYRRPSFQLSFYIYPGASFKCSLISSWSLCSFASKSPLAYCFFLILTMVHSRFFFLDYNINSFVHFNPTGGSRRPSKVCDMSLLNPFQEE